MCLLIVYFISTGANEVAYSNRREFHHDMPLKYDYLDRHVYVFIVHQNTGLSGLVNFRIIATLVNPKTRKICAKSNELVFKNTIHGIQGQLQFYIQRNVANYVFEVRIFSYDRIQAVPSS